MGLSLESLKNISRRLAGVKETLNRQLAGNHASTNVQESQPATGRDITARPQPLRLPGERPLSIENLGDDDLRG